MGGPGLWGNNGGVGRGLFWHNPYSKEQCYLLEALTCKYLHHSSSLCTSQLNQASADNNDHDNYKAHGDECCVGRVNSLYQRPAETEWSHFYIQMYMRCRCWDLLPPDQLDAGLLHGYCPSAYLLLQVHCGDVSTRQQETNFWNQFREWWIENSNHTCPRLCKILAKEKGKCLINLLK